MAGRRTQQTRWQKTVIHSCLSLILDQCFIVQFVRSHTHTHLFAKCIPCDTNWLHHFRDISMPYTVRKFSINIWMWYHQCLISIYKTAFKRHTHTKSEFVHWRHSMLYTVRDWPSFRICWLLGLPVVVAAANTTIKKKSLIAGCWNVVQWCVLLSHRPNTMTNVRHRVAASKMYVNRFLRNAPHRKHFLNI